MLTFEDSLPAFEVLHQAALAYADVATCPPGSVDTHDELNTAEHVLCEAAKNWAAFTVRESLVLRTTSRPVSFELTAEPVST